jgi:hypothetical protein
MCVGPPLLAVAKLICPGFDFASLMSSAAERAGTDGWTTNAIGSVAVSVIGAKSFTGS